MMKRPILFAAAAATALSFGAVPGAPAETLNPLAGIEEGAVSAFTERPLFSKSRRPYSRTVLPSSGAAPLALAPPSIDGLRLIGTLRNERGVLARVQDRSSQTRSVRSGDTVEGWTVMEIAPASLSLRQGEHTASLALFVPGAVRPAPNAMPAQAATIPAARANTTGRTAAPSSLASPTAPRGTVAGTAAAEAAANAPFQLTFGGTPRP